MPERKTMAINTKAKALLPNGTVLDRPSILGQLGLDPNTPPDAWLAIVACGSNAAALKPNELRTVLTGGNLRGTALTEVQKLARTRNIT